MQTIQSKTWLPQFNSAEAKNKAFNVTEGTYLGKTTMSAQVDKVKNPKWGEVPFPEGVSILPENLNSTPPPSTRFFWNSLLFKVTFVIEYLPGKFSWYTKVQNQGTKREG